MGTRAIQQGWMGTLSLSTKNAFVGKGAKMAGWIVHNSKGRIVGGIAQTSMWQQPRARGGRASLPWTPVGTPSCRPAALKLAFPHEAMAAALHVLNTPQQTAGKGLSMKRGSLSNWLGAERSFASTGDESGGVQGRFKQIMKEYGKVALLSHSTIWAGSLAATYAALNAMDINSVLALLPQSISSHLDPKAGAFAIAFVLTKITGPARLMIDIAITPTLAGYLRNTWLAGPLGLRKAAEVAAQQPVGSDSKPDSYTTVGQLARPYATDYANAGSMYGVNKTLLRKSKHARAAAGKMMVRAQKGFAGVRAAGNERARKTLLWARKVGGRRLAKPIPIPKKKTDI